MDDDVPATFEDGQQLKVIPGEGTHRCSRRNSNLVPENIRKYRRNVKRVDKNGTPSRYLHTNCNTSYTNCKPVTSIGKKGQTQTGQTNLHRR